MRRWSCLAALPYLLSPAYAAGLGPSSGEPVAPAVSERASSYSHWLEERAMLQQARVLARHYSGNSIQWQHPYGQPQPHAAVARASVWFTAYPASKIAASPGTSVISTLAEERLWSAFQAIGIQGIHTGPMKRSGGVRDLGYTPSIDGNFDRISFEIDPAFGTEAQYKAMVAAARSHGAIVIGDVIPGHTGKGPDFRLAERAYADYPGLYHMVQIEPRDWGLLPPVPAGHDAVNLTPAAVDALQKKGYIVGQLHSGIFYEPGVKDTDWSATDVVRGADGVQRRWVYLHYFKQGQPTLNWLDPSFAAERLVIGDAVHELAVLGDGMLRLDANGLLGIERDPTGRVWWAGHPLSLTANQLIADMVRKLDGFTFEELALPLDVMREMSRGGPDLSYDFVTRPAYDHALLTGDAEFLRLVFQLMREYGIDPGRLIRAAESRRADHGYFPLRGACGRDLPLSRRQADRQGAARAGAARDVRAAARRTRSLQSQVRRGRGEHHGHRRRRYAWHPGPRGAEARGRGEDQEAASAARVLQRHAAGGICALRVGPRRSAHPPRSVGARAARRRRHPLDQPRGL